MTTTTTLTTHTPSTYLPTETSEEELSLSVNTNVTSNPYPPSASSRSPSPPDQLTTPSTVDIPTSSNPSKRSHTSKDHHPVDLPLNLTIMYNISGHSTGGRAVHMLAAAQDDPDYLRSVDYIRLTERHICILRKIVAVVADHPDPMYDPALNPDVDRYGITRTPAMIVTGTRDVSPLGEPVGSAWGDFIGLDGMEDRVFLNMAEVTHAQPVVSHGVLMR